MSAVQWVIAQRSVADSLAITQRSITTAWTIAVWGLEKTVMQFIERLGHCTTQYGHHLGHIKPLTAYCTTTSVHLHYAQHASNQNRNAARGSCIAHQRISSGKYCLQGGEVSTPSKSLTSA